MACRPSSDASARNRSGFSRAYSAGESCAPRPAGHWPPPQLHVAEYRRSRDSRIPDVASGSATPPRFDHHLGAAPPGLCATLEPPRALSARRRSARRVEEQTDVWPPLVSLSRCLRRSSYAQLFVAVIANSSVVVKVFLKERRAHGRQPDAIVITTPLYRIAAACGTMYGVVSDSCVLIYRRVISDYAAKV